MTFHKGKIRSYLAAILMAALVLVAVGCGEAEIAEENADAVFRYAGKDVSLGEVYLYANTVIEDYESIYGNEIWGTSISVSKDDTANMEDVTRRDIIENIVHVKMLNAKASDYKVALTEDDEKTVASETDAFYAKLTDDQIHDMQLSYDLVKSVMQENMVARKVYDKIIGEAGIEVSDEEARELLTLFGAPFQA